MKRQETTEGQKTTRDRKRQRDSKRQRERARKRDKEVSACKRDIIDHHNLTPISNINQTYFCSVSVWTSTPEPKLQPSKPWA